MRNLKFLFILIACLNSLQSYSSAMDVGVVGSDGNVLLYYREDDSIVLKKCSKNSVLGSTPSSARMNCIGESKRIPLVTFEAALRNYISPSRLFDLKPLSPRDIYIYNEETPNEAQREINHLELQKINAFIKAYGPENADLIRKDELERSLISLDQRLEVFQRVNDQLDDVLRKISDSSKLTIVKASTHGDQILYSVLKEFSITHVQPCGLRGSLEQRIENCSRVSSDQKGKVKLVMRTRELEKVFYDPQTGYLWTENLGVVSFRAGERMCAKFSLLALNGINWSVPSVADFKSVHKQGLPAYEFIYLTSDRSNDSSKRLTWSSIYTAYPQGRIDTTDEWDESGIRCVGKRF